MKCNDALDVVYEAPDVLPLKKRLSLAFHIIFCGHCAFHQEKYKEAHFLLQNSFFPLSPDYTDSIMDRIYKESFNEEAAEQFTGPGGVSVRGWVIAGIVLLISLATVFFGRDFSIIAMDQGSSFLIPLGIITGIVITGYGALFVGSHLKEFSQRFKL